jgi:hypothetical protein
MYLHIIYTQREMLLSKRAYSSWREIQDEYTDYQTSLGPWAEEEVIEYLSDEYPDLEPSAEQQVASLVSSAQPAHTLSFRRR